MSDSDGQLHIMSKENFNLFKQNDAIFSVVDRLKKVYQTFHITCPMCGFDNIVSNNNPDSTIFTLDRVGRLDAKCGNCKALVTMPIKFE